MSIYFKPWLLYLVWRMCKRKDYKSLAEYCFKELNPILYYIAEVYPVHSTNLTRKLVFTYIDSISYIAQHVNTEMFILYTAYPSYITMNSSWGILYHCKSAQPKCNCKMLDHNACFRCNTSRLLNQYVVCFLDITRVKQRDYIQFVKLIA